MLEKQSNLNQSCRFCWSRVSAGTNGRAVDEKENKMIDATEQVLAEAPTHGRRRAGTVTGTRASKSAGGAPRKSLGIQRTFSDPKVNPFDQVEWERRTAEITDDAGKVIFKQENVEVPKTLVAARHQDGGLEIFLRRAGHAANGRPRCASSSTGSAGPSPIGASRTDISRKADGEVFYDELVWLCLNQYGAFNSPVWFNVGLYHHIRHRQKLQPGQLVLQPADRRRPSAPPPNTNTRRAAPASSSRVEDNMEDIMHLAHSEAMLFKYGSGTGSDLSPIRSSKEKLSGGGRPSGPLSFLKVYDQVANVVKSGGKTRRAAKMNTLNDWHGDIEEFIDAKTEGGKEGLGADRAGLRRLLQRRRLRQRHVSERKPLRPRQRRVHAGRRGRQGMVDAAVTTGKPLREERRRASCCTRSPKAPGSAAIPACSSTAPSRSGTPAKAPSRSTPPIPAPNMCSSTTPPATSPR